MKLLIIDNFDSFTFNIVEQIRKIGGVQLDVVMNNHVDVSYIERYDKIIFSPGPGLPKDFPIMFKILERYSKTRSILGICLGHQAIAEFFGGQLENLDSVVHGIKKSITVVNEQDSLFQNIPSAFDAGFYHSWIVSKKNFPSELIITAVDSENKIMAFSHSQYDLKGIQFHPESFMTNVGEKIISNWLKHEWQ